MLADLTLESIVMLKIISVLPLSSADSLDLKSGDQIVSINNNTISDKLDFTYFIQDESLIIDILRSGKTITLKIENNTSYSESDWGIILDEYKIKSCGNNCIFCFVHQNPQGLRKTIYVKDEDYRFSFLYGSYFTLTNITKSELERIAVMRLSPLYISVHATDADVRKNLLGIKKNDNILQKLDFLINKGIQLHTQIVLCPNINDAEILDNTVMELAKRHPGVESVAVVPVGKTAHRENLPYIKSADSDDALKVISLIDNLQIELLPKIKTRFVYAADEFYLKASLAIPDNEYYENFDQYENGIGLIRSFLNELNAYKKKLPAKLKNPKTVFLVTGRAFAPVLEASLLPYLQKIKNLNTIVIAVENKLFGYEVTVAGLLCGKDLLDAIKSSDLTPDLIVLPPTCLNYDNLFLDDMSFSEFLNHAATTVELYTNFERLISLITM